MLREAEIHHSNLFTRSRKLLSGRFVVGLSRTTRFSQLTILGLTMCSKVLQHPALTLKGNVVEKYVEQIMIFFLVIQNPNSKVEVITLLCAFNLNRAPLKCQLKLGSVKAHGILLSHT